MTPEFEEALGLWESGELSRDELSRRFPGEDVAGVLDEFDRMSAASTGATPDAGAAWTAVRTRLPARLSDRRRGRGKAIRLLAAASIAVLVLGAAAYAVVPSVRRAMNDAAGAITGDTGSSSHLTGPDGSAGAAGQPTPGITDEIASTADPDEGVAEENDADANADADEQDADNDADSGANSGSDDEADDVGSETDGGPGSDEGSLEGGSGSGEEADGGTVDGDGANSGSETAEG
jgi:5'-nucleotidase